MRGTRQRFRFATSFCDRDNATTFLGPEIHDNFNNIATARQRCAAHLKRGGRVNMGPFPPGPPGILTRCSKFGHERHGSKPQICRLSIDPCSGMSGICIQFFLAHWFGSTACLQMVAKLHKLHCSVITRTFRRQPGVFCVLNLTV